MQVAVGIAMLLFGAYMAYEVWRWVAGNRAALTPGQFRRRLAGGILIEIDLAMWLLAKPAFEWMRATFPRPVAPAALYLLTVVLLAAIAMLLAVREAGFVARQYAQWRSELFREMGRRREDE